jgi:hypothetical protein
MQQVYQSPFNESCVRRGSFLGETDPAHTFELRLFVFSERETDGGNIVIQQLKRVERFIFGS